jgi:hypothetical protein
MPVSSIARLICLSACLVAVFCYAIEERGSLDSVLAVSAAQRKTIVLAL